MPRSRRTTILLILHWLVAASLIVAYLGLALAGTRVDTPGFLIPPAVFEYGWPCVCLTRVVDYTGGAGRWAVWEGTRDWDVRGALVDALCFVVVTGGIIGYAIWKSCKGRLCRLSLMECLAATLFIAIVAAHFAACMRRSQESIRMADEIDALDGYVDLRYGGPRWLARVHGDVTDASPFGIDFYAVDYLSLPHDPSKARDALKILTPRPKVRVLDVSYDDWDEETTRQVLRALRQCRPEVVILWYTSPPDAVIAEVAAFPTLRELYLDSEGTDDRHVAVLRNCRTLRVLDVSQTDVSPTGIRELLTFPHLREIYVDRELLKQHPELKQFATEHGKKLKVVPPSKPVVG